MLRLGLNPYVMHSYSGDISLATMTVSHVGPSSMTMLFERLRELTPTEADIAKSAGAGEFRSHSTPPPSAHEFADPTG